MGNGEYLHLARGNAIDQAELENLEADAADIGRIQQARSLWHFAGESHGRLKCSVVAGAETSLGFLVVRNLLQMLLRCLRVQPVVHRSSACT